MIQLPWGVAPHRLHTLTDFVLLLVYDFADEHQTFLQELLDHISCLADHCM
jgi:hypothetical protein